ncbi:MAG TPA: aminotransferase class IV [Isosphaeraceae bacterium]|jgi:branched-subunit amino acid aminotransferase/4-amino-4-deoxychorismate lyase
MIWVGGRIVPDDALRISVLDRTFEHGLGLFETLRTWNGHATLLDRHLARMARSAEALRLPLDPAALPDRGAVADLLGAADVEGDAVLRITLSGGLSESGGSVLWMRAAPLPPPIRAGGARVQWHSWPVFSNEPLAGHKSLNYWQKRLLHEEARADGFDEVLGVSWARTIQEGTRTNLFVVQDGVVKTPGLYCDLLPGIMRGVVLERARHLGLDVSEGALACSLLDEVDEAFLTNSVRGIIPICELRDRELPAPGPLTRRLWDDILPWLKAGGTPP